ncbi:MAG: Stp1/IreP family PP2C-type Ser/Thr phosphatase [Actinomycetota bacterium]
MMIKVGATSDIGQVREGNEDSFLVLDPLYAVADGMGGHRGGEVASNLALQTIQRLFTAQEGTLTEQVEQANRAVFERSQSDRDVAGMGTTLTAALVQGAQVRLAHVGDSRAYLYRDGELQLLTEDHTLVHKMLMEGEISESEAETHPHRSILTRALGVDGSVQVDEEVVEMRNGDRLLLCTDGLTGMVSDEQIKAVLAESKDPQEAVDRLVRAANRAGGIDNITAVVIDFVEDGSGDGTKEAAVPHQPTKQQPVPVLPPPGRTDITVVGRPIPEAPPKDRASAPARASREPDPARAGRVPSDRRPPGRPRRSGRALRKAGVGVGVLLAVVVLGMVGLRFYLDTQWFVGVSNGRVAIFRGVPAEIGGYDLNSVVVETTIRADDAQSLALYRELPDGITADDREAAEAIVEQIRRDVASRLTQPVGS